MNNSSNKSCAVALPKERNSATFTQKTATAGATNTQPISLKALASKVSERNKERNSTATRLKTDRNFSPEESATQACRKCRRLEILTIFGKPVAGCLYQIPGAKYSEGWKRLPADMTTCIFN